MEKLKQLSASIAVFNMKLYNIHFNYSGKEFLSIHKTTEELYKIIAEHYDQISEKIRMNDEIVPATFEESLKLSIIQEQKFKKVSLNEQVAILQNDFDSLIKFVSNIAGSPTVQPVLDELLLDLDKFRWLFKSMSL